MRDKNMLFPIWNIIFVKYAARKSILVKQCGKLKLTLQRSNYQNQLKENNLQARAYKA